MASRTKTNIACACGAALFSVLAVPGQGWAAGLPVPLPTISVPVTTVIGVTLPPPPVTVPSPPTVHPPVPPPPVVHVPVPPPPVVHVPAPPPPAVHVPPPAIHGPAPTTHVTIRTNTPTLVSPAALAPSVKGDTRSGPVSGPSAGRLSGGSPSASAGAPPISGARHAGGNWRAVAARVQTPIGAVGIPSSGPTVHGSAAPPPVSGGRAVAPFANAGAAANRSAKRPSSSPSALPSKKASTGLDKLLGLIAPPLPSEAWLIGLLVLAWGLLVAFLFGDEERRSRWMHRSLR